MEVDQIRGRSEFLRSGSTRGPGQRCEHTGKPSKFPGTQKTAVRRRRLQASMWSARMEPHIVWEWPEETSFQTTALKKRITSIWRDQNFGLVPLDRNWFWILNFPRCRSKWKSNVRGVFSGREPSARASRKCATACGISSIITSSSKVTAGRVMCTCISSEPTA